MLQDHIIEYIIRNMFEIKKDEFKLKEKFECENYFGDAIKAPVWMIEGKIGTDKFQACLCELSNDYGVLQEFILLTKLEDSPTYASYWSNDIEDEMVQSTLSYSTQENVWMPTNTYLQATYLAGMESLKDVLVEWKLPSDISVLNNSLKSFYNHTMEDVEDDEIEDAL